MHGVARALELAWKEPRQPRTLEAMLSSTKGLPDILALDGLQDVDETTRLSWLELVSHWALVNKHLVEQELPLTTLCLVTPAASILTWLPPPEVHLVTRWWWGVPSGLETRLLCRQDPGPAWSDLLPSLWREQILAALAGSDLILIEDMWDHLFQSPSDIFEALCQSGWRRGWTEQALKGWGIDTVMTDVLSHVQHLGFAPSPPVRRLWAQGVLSCTPEYGMEVDSAALAVLGRTDEVLHRLWRGQVSLLLPIIDHARLKICGDLTRMFGYDWPWRWILPENEKEQESVRDNPYTCQLGHLNNLFWCCSSLKPASYWKPVIGHLQRVRNQLAHYRPVSYREVETLWGEIHRVDELRADISSGRSSIAQRSW